MNLLGPAKLTDVDMEKQRAGASRDLLQEILHGQPNVKEFKELYVPKELQGNLTPDQIEKLRLLKTLEKEAQAKAKANKPMNIGVQLK
jgi:hypothetical protein